MVVISFDNDARSWNVSGWCLNDDMGATTTRVRGYLRQWQGDVDDENGEVVGSTTNMRWC
jgi:hypothetical protein